MSVQSNFDLISSKHVLWAACGAVGLVGGLALLGWKFDIAIPGLAAMKANAALALVLSALSLWLLSKETDARLLLAGRFCAAVVVLIGLLTLAEHLLGLSLGIDQLLFNDPAAEAGPSRPGRMDPVTAAMLLLLGVELSMLGAAVDARIPQSMALATGLLSLVALSGYLYGIPALYTVGPYAAVAPHAALAFMILSLGVLFARPDAGLLAAVAGDNTGGVSALRWLPVAVGVPLMLGYLTLLGQRTGFYNSEFGLALFALANAVFFAVVIVRNARSLAQRESTRKRSERRLQRDLDRLRALSDSEMAISAAPNPSAVPGILLEKTEFLIPVAAAATVRLFNRRSGELETAASRTRSREQWTLDENKALGGRAKKVFETKMPLTIRNLQTDGQVTNQVFRRQGLVSYQGIPLLAQGEALGVLGVYTQADHEFTEQEVDCLRSLAGRASMAVYNTPLRDEIEPSKAEKSEPEPTNDRLKQLLRLLPELYAALAPLNTAESLQETVEGIIEKLLEATGADAALIRVWKKETGAALVVGQRGFSDDHVRQMEVGLLGGALEWVVQHGEPIIASDIELEPRFKTKVQQQLGFRSCALLPLRIHQSVRGVIHLAGRTPGHFDEEQKDLLVAIAQQMGISMENRELFDHLKDSRNEFEKAIKVKDEFLSVMSHELRTPLSVVMGYAGMIKEKLLGEINPQQEDALQKLLTRANDQLTMINAIMQITQLESRALVLERHLVNLAELLGHLKSDYALSHTKEKVALVWDYPSEPVAIVTDGGKLKEILVNLINNAIKFTPSGSVTVSMRLTEDLQKRQWVELKVADSGLGIAEEHLGAIFNKFYQVDSSETRAYGGTGLGLYIVKNFTEFLGGRIDVASEPGKGSTFTVKIPYAT